MKNYYCFILVFLSLACCVQAQERVLLWEEEFDENDLDESNWNFELGDGCPELCGWGNEERQIYTRSNHVIKDGYLHIQAKLNDSVYTSTRITTQDKFEFQYGWIEARIKLPSGKGLWPAFWMLGANIDQVGWPNCGEIDIMEYVGKKPGVIFSTLHTADSFGNSINTKEDHRKGIEDDFHIFAAHWTKDQISFYIDGVEFYQFAPQVKSSKIWPFDQPFYIILNLAIGGGFGGPQVDDSIFPQEFIIDYIRVFKDSNN